MTADERPNLLAAAIQRRSSWYWRFVFWRITSWTLTVIIAGGSALVASNLTEYQNARNIIAVVVATCAALQAALAPETKAIAFRRSWIGLDLELLKLSGLPTSLINSIRKGEEGIGPTHASSIQVTPPQTANAENSN